MNQIATLPIDLQKTGWALETDGCAINKTFRFDSFPAAMAFMYRIAFKCEELDHHPEWFNVYNRVEVRLTTHDSGGLSDKGFTLAQFMETVSG